MLLQVAPNAFGSIKSKSLLARITAAADAAAVDVIALNPREYEIVDRHSRAVLAKVDSPIHIESTCKALSFRQ